MIVVDNTILASTQCSTAAALRHALGYAASEDAAPLAAGKAVHEMLATWLRTSGSRDAALATLAEQYKAWATEHVVDPDDRLSWDNVRKVMTQWVAVHSIGTFPVLVDPSLVEVGFALPLADDIVFVGRMDALGRDGHGAWTVVDWKTSAALNKRWREAHRLSAQMTGYTWAARHYVNEPVVGALIGGIELSKLPDSTRRCRLHGRAYAECGPMHATFDTFITQRTEAQQALWRDTAIVLARRFAALRASVATIDDIAAVPMEGQFVGACPSCQFRDYCSLGRPTDPVTVNALLRHEPWEPYQHACGTPPPVGT